MKSETKYLDKTEVCYETEYALRKDIHYRKGEILKLEHINAKHCREIERLQGMLNEEGNSINDLNVKHRNDVATLANRINELEFELNMRNVPAMKESLKSSARLAIKQDDQINRINELKNMFEYLKVLLINLSHKEGNQPINPDDIDVKYIEAASRYCFPVLFDKYAILDQDNNHKIELANSILDKFGIETMEMYEMLIMYGEIGIAFIDNRDEGPSLTHMGGDTKSDKW